jgi:hypothetical protein
MDMLENLWDEMTTHVQLQTPNSISLCQSTLSGHPEAQLLMVLVTGFPVENKLHTNRHCLYECVLIDEERRIIDVAFSHFWKHRHDTEVLFGILVELHNVKQT